MKFFLRLQWREWMLFLIPLALLALPVLLGLNWRPLNPFFYPRERAQREHCQINLRVIGAAMAQYTRDYDHKFPVASSVAYGTGISISWYDEMQPYFNSRDCFHCPSDTFFIPPNISSYWFNANLFDTYRHQLYQSRSTLLFGEGDDGKDVSDSTYAKSSLSQQWITDPNSPVWRHLGGANYLMADGSVHWLKPNEVTTFGGRKNAFAVK